MEELCPRWENVRSLTNNPSCLLRLQNLNNPSPIRLKNLINLTSVYHLQRLPNTKTVHTIRLYFNLAKIMFAKRSRFEIKFFNRTILYFHHVCLDFKNQDGRTRVS